MFISQAGLYRLLHHAIIAMHQGSRCIDLFSAPGCCADPKTLSTAVWWRHCYDRGPPVWLESRYGCGLEMSPKFFGMCG
jgi:hypothetical protein